MTCANAFDHTVNGRILSAPTKMNESYDRNFARVVILEQREESRAQAKPVDKGREKLYNIVIILKYGFCHKGKIMELTKIFGNKTNATYYYVKRNGVTPCPPDGEKA